MKKLVEECVISFNKYTGAAINEKKIIYFGRNSFVMDGQENKEDE